MVDTKEKAARPNAGGRYNGNPHNPDKVLQRPLRPVLFGTERACLDSN